MSLWGIAWLTCIQKNLGALKMLGECSTRSCMLPPWDMVTWNAMILGLVKCRQGQKALEQMQHKCMWSNYSYLCICQCSCGWRGQVCPWADHWMDHYTCIVDLLGHAGYLQEAEIWSRPCADNHMRKTLLSACRIHGNVEMGEHVAKQVLRLDSENISGYVLLSDIYAPPDKRHLWGCWMAEKGKRCEETAGSHLDWKE